MTTYKYTTAYLKKFGKAGTYDLNASEVITRNGMARKSLFPCTPDYSFANHKFNLPRLANLGKLSL